MSSLSSRILYNLGLISKRIRRLAKFGHIKGLGSQTVSSSDIKTANFYLKHKHLYYDEEVIKKYENNFEKYNECKNAFSFAAGRVALSACIEALELKEGAYVMVPAYTCVVVPNAFWFRKLNILFYDIELDTYGPSLADLKRKWRPGVKAILIHHLFGIVCRDYEALIQFARDKKAYVIEDCAHSAGARYKGKRVGNYGDVAFYSSEQSKVYSTFNGGIATTNSDRLAEKMNDYYKCAPFPSTERVEKLLYSFKHCYLSQKHLLAYVFPQLYLYQYENKILPSTTKDEKSFNKPVYYGQRLAAPLAAIGSNQIRKVDFYNAKRRKRAKELRRWAIGQGYMPPLIIDNSEPVFLRYPLLGDGNERNRKLELSEELKSSVGEWFVSYLHPVPYAITDCQNASTAVKGCFNIATL